jgi:hypothetical protein
MYVFSTHTIFFTNIFSVRLVGSFNAKAMDMEGQLYLHLRLVNGYIAVHCDSIYLYFKIFYINCF